MFREIDFWSSSSDILFERKSHPNNFLNKFFLDYKAKYLGESQEITPARLSKEQEEKVNKVAKLVYKIIKVKKTKSRYTVGGDAKLVNYGSRLLPKGLFDKLLESNYKISRK